jgi:hypothetical protein
MLYHLGAQGAQETPHLGSAWRHVGYSPKAIDDRNPDSGLLYPSDNRVEQVIQGRIFDARV